MESLKVSKINNSLTVTLSPEILEKLQVREGDIIVVNETSNGIELVVSDLAFESGMEAYWRISSKYATALQELAK